MIFTSLGEHFGLAGLFAILGLYLLIIYRGYRIAIESRDPFSKLLAAGLTSIFAIQTIIIIAGNMKFFPLTGIPLPFLSYGGSSSSPTSSSSASCCASPTTTPWNAKD